MTDPTAKLESRFSDPEAGPTSWSDAARVLEGAELYWLTTASVLRTRALPAWLGWSAAVIAVLLVANSLDLASDFGPAFLLYLLWVLAAAIVLLRRAMTVAAPAGARAPQPLASS